MYHIYILENFSSSYFLGITTDFKSKLEEHKKTLIRKGQDSSNLKVLFVLYYRDAIRALSKFKELQKLNNKQLKDHVLQKKYL